MLLQDWIMWWACAAFIIFMMFVFALPMGGWKRLWGKYKGSPRRAWRHLWTCSDCKAVYGHTEDCAYVARTWGGYAREDEWR